MVQQRIIGRGPKVIGSHPTRCPNCGRRMTFRIFEKRKPSNLFASAHCRRCAMKFQVVERRPGAFPPTWNPDARDAASEAPPQPVGATGAEGMPSASSGGSSEAAHEEAPSPPVQRTVEPEEDLGSVPAAVDLPAETTADEPNPYMEALPWRR